MVGIEKVSFVGANAGWEKVSKEGADREPPIVDFTAEPLMLNFPISCFNTCA